MKNLAEVRRRNNSVATPTEMKAIQLFVAFPFCPYSVGYREPLITVGSTGPSPYPRSPFPFPVSADV